MKKTKNNRFRIVSITLTVIAAVALLSVAVVAFYSRNLPNPADFQFGSIDQSTKIYDRTGEELLYEIHGEEKRTIIPFEQIPEDVKKATIVVEDDNFYDHPAFDVRGMIRALAVDFMTGKPAQGGSTITQQLVKNAFLTRDKTLARKVRELILAIKMEKQYSKDEILNLYLNQVPYGSNAYGIEAASQTFFNKKASELTLAQSAILAALPHRPSYYSPYGTHTEDLFNRQKFILDKLKKSGYIDDEEYSRAIEEKIDFAPSTDKMKAPHFVMYVREYLNNKYGEEFVTRSGLRVYTTLDWDLQEKAEKAVVDGVARNKKLYNGNNAALVAQDPKTGQILAMVGSFDYFDQEHDGNFNVATQGLRQPGSSFKPFAYLSAFKKGYTPETIVFDLQTDFNAGGDPLKAYKPGNYDHIFRGPISLRNALAQSVNVPAVKVLYLAGMDNTIETARALGITTLTDKSRYGLSLVLGGGEVKLIEMVGAYSTLSQDGVRHQQASILKVEDSEGKVLEEYKDAAEQVYDAQSIRILNDVLSDDVARRPLFGSNNLLTIPGHEIAAKTGTTNDFRDAWTMGYTPSLVAGVWAGNNNNTPMNIGGSSILAAVPIWNAFMKEALAERTLEPFIRPDPYAVSQKPMLNGEYIARYRNDNEELPHIHDILFYVDKNDPLGPPPANPASDSQFSNWERPVMDWAAANIPDFAKFNRPLPGDSLLTNTGKGGGQPSIQVRSPSNGQFISGKIQISASFKAPEGIRGMRIRFNGTTIDERRFERDRNETDVSLSMEYEPQRIELQNSMEFEIADFNDNSVKETLILFK